MSNSTEKGATWRFVIQTLLAILTAIGTTLGVTSCMAGRKTDKCRENWQSVLQPSTGIYSAKQSDPTKKANREILHLPYGSKKHIT